MKRRTLVSFALSCFATGLLQAQVNVPKIGVARYADSSIRTVYGIESSFVVDRQALGSADSISFSNSGGLLSANGNIKLLDSAFSVVAEFDSGEKTPQLNVDGPLVSAIAWLPSQHALLHWTGTSFVLTPVNGAAFDQVSSVRVVSPSSAQILFSEADAVFQGLVSLENGNVISITPLPGVQSPAYRQGSFVLFCDKNGLEVAPPAGALQTFAVHAPDLTFERMSSEWLHLSSPATGRNWALHLNGGVAHLAELPQPPSKVIASSAVTDAQEAVK